MTGGSVTGPAWVGGTTNPDEEHNADVRLRLLTAGIAAERGALRTANGRINELESELQTMRGQIDAYERALNAYEMVRQATESAVDDERAAVDELVEAIRLTVEYVGMNILPPIAGWSWYDALAKHAPEVAALFVRPDEQPDEETR